MSRQNTPALQKSVLIKLKQVNNIFDIQKLHEYILLTCYFIALISSTCFFFDAREFSTNGYTIQLPIGLTFFPLTFALSNIIQDKFGKRTANSLIASAFIADTFFVFGGLFLAYIGDRADYKTVFYDLPYIMISTWFFLIVSGVFNISLYNYLSKFRIDHIWGILLRFFFTITMSELLISSLSMPLLFYKHGLHGNVVLTICCIVAYKIFANIIITFVYRLLYCK